MALLVPTEPDDKESRKQPESEIAAFLKGTNRDIWHISLLKKLLHSPAH